MKGLLRSLGPAVVSALLVGGCGPSEETASRPPEVPMTKEALFQAGHQLYLQQSYDSAAVLLERAAAIDSGYRDPVQDLAQLYYEQGMNFGADKDARKARTLRMSRTQFARLEKMGMNTAEVYERLCEISVMLDDDRTFLRYAKRYADQFPYDRQMYNLGIAYLNVGEYQQVIKSQREAKDKFPDSPYLGGFYRQLGRAYRKVDRDQTAERIFTEGVRAVDGRIAALRKANSGFRSTSDYHRLLDDKVGMLQELKRLHQIYKAKEKLEQVERQLKELGHDE